MVILHRIFLSIDERRTITLLPLICMQQPGLFRQNRSKTKHFHCSSKLFSEIQFCCCWFLLLFPIFVFPVELNRCFNLNPSANRSNIIGQQLPNHCWILHVASVYHVACCCVLLGVVAQSLKPVKLLATCKRTQQLPTMLHPPARGF